MKVYRRVEVLLHSFLTSSLDGKEWSSTHPGKESSLLTELADGWTPDEAWAFWRIETDLAQLVVETRNVQTVSLL